nr:M-phase phosphoprotein 6-like [Saimiri boliviensis boliviensis]
MKPWNTTAARQWAKVISRLRNVQTKYVHTAMLRSLRALHFARAVGACGGARGECGTGRSHVAAERKTKVSKNRLRRRFMQRGLDSETRRRLAGEEKKIVSEERRYVGLPELKEKESFLTEEPSFLLREGFLHGRTSLRGFHPEVEKLMLRVNTRLNAAEVEDAAVELDVSDEAMARRYETVVGTVGKKFARKTDHANYEEGENGDITTD